MEAENQNDLSVDRIVAGNIRRIRIARQVYQQNLAWLLGFEPRHWRRCEAGIVKIPSGKLWIIKEALQCSLEDLFEGAGKLNLKTEIKQEGKRK